MPGSEDERLAELYALAAAEQDAEKLMTILREIVRIVTAKEDAEKGKPPSGKKPDSEQ